MPLQALSEAIDYLSPEAKLCWPAGSSWVKLPKAQTSALRSTEMVCSFSQTCAMGLDVVQENPPHLKSGQRPRKSLRHTDPSVMRKVIAVPSGEGEVWAMF